MAKSDEIIELQTASKKATKNLAAVAARPRPDIVFEMTVVRKNKVRRYAASFMSAYS